jgi:hypothetical protein
LLGKRANAILRGALFLYLGLVLCPIRCCAPTDNSVDNTWFFALNYAAVHHLVMGRDIALTVGPLFSLLVPLDVGDNLARGLAFQSALWALIVVMLWDLFFRCGFPLRNLRFFSFAIGLSTFDYHQALSPGNLLLTATLILLVHFRLRGGISSYIGALALMGLTPLLQFIGALISASVTGGLIVGLRQVELAIHPALQRHNVQIGTANRAGRGA